ncbi:type 2 periplasmic-binding domain-containing protein [Mycoplasmopsis felis]|uniref:hypothetical protein n=1 Tax=Mycoplasmopsis felis TaxID=33923 RepID=UPI002AF6C955|nr:hypothetical protein [Mycoplasmopsis felis]WQQ02510.1 hypothetical protein RNN91_00305 [Mycoplasmopsis felis]WRX06308.1 hypothetical protein O7984_02075 [Mycoplasmopsis felis]
MKKFKRFIIFGASLLFLSTIFITTLTLKKNKSFKPSFYNYKSYMSNDNIEHLNNTFDYKEFDEINQFTNALINNKAAAGIGSDFLAAELANKGLISKLDYSILLNLPELKNYLKYDDYLKEFNELNIQLKNTKDQEQKASLNNKILKIQQNLNDSKKAKELIKQYVKLTLRPEIWNHLNSYNLNDNNELWEYFYPYYSQDMVIAYNIKKVSINPENLDENQSIDISKYIDKFINTEPNKEIIQNPYSIINLLKIISENGYDKWVITDAVRDNMLYGSSYWPLPNGRTNEKFTGIVQEEDNNSKPYEILIDSFVDLIKDGTGFDIRNNKHITLKGDGLEIVNDLINPNRPDINAAIMYNGDAIDSYYGSDNFPNQVEDGEIRAIKPNQNILLVDGLVLSNKLNQETKDDFMHNISTGYYSYLSKVIQKYKSIFNQDLEQNFDNLQNKLVENHIIEIWKDFKTNELSEQWNDLNNDVIINFVNKIASIIDLSSQENNQEFINFYDLRQKYLKKAEQDINKNDAINYSSYLMKEFLNKNYSDFMNNLVNKILEISNNNFEVKEEELLKLNQDEFSKMIIKNTLTFIEEFLQKIKENENKEEFIFDTIINSLVFIDLSNEEYLKNYNNLSNFNFINYVPTSITDYELIYRFYFFDKYDNHDFNAINMFEIINTDAIKHESIKPVNDKLLSKITTYYFSKIKS